MKLVCPHCGRAVKRASGGEAPSSATNGFSFAELLSGAYWCESCGRVAKDAFSQEDRRRIGLATLCYVGGSIIALASIVAMVLLGLKHGEWLGR